jgi:hypothetical protein
LAAVPGHGSRASREGAPSPRGSHGDRGFTPQQVWASEISAPPFFAHLVPLVIVQKFRKTRKLGIGTCLSSSGRNDVLIRFFAMAHADKPCVLLPTACLPAAIERRPRDDTGRCPACTPVRLLLRRLSPGNDGCDVIPIPGPLTWSARADPAQDESVLSSAVVRSKAGGCHNRACRVRRARLLLL